MANEKYVVGIDFGTLSGRVVVVRTSDGVTVGEAVKEYTHGVMDTKLTAGDGQTLPPEFALQVPADYMEVFAQAIPEAIAASGVNKEDIVGIGVDATSATVFVTTADGTPINELPGFENNPHAYIKLWKHHGAQDQADRLVKLAQDRNEPWLGRYGGVLSSELLLPKVLEIFEKAPEVYEKTDVIINLLDWATWKLTGVLAYSAGDSGYKRMYQDGSYPSKEYLEAAAPGFGDVFETKMAGEIIPLGGKVGEVTAEMAELTGLPAGIAVAAGNIDAHVVVAGANAVKPGQLTAIMGTSTCYVVSTEEYNDCPGIFGTVLGGAVDGLWGYEAGQTAVGDIFAWFTDSHVPAEYVAEAKEAGISVHELLVRKAEAQEIGAHGIVALDWFNGNRSPLSDSLLSGLILGQTLTTKPEDTYRALLESTAFGARVIIENFEAHGIEIKEIVGAGGLLKNKFYMQMLSDITRRPIHVSNAPQTGALGSAVFAAVAAGVYDNVLTASEAMADTTENAYLPDETRAAKYDKLYEVYQELSDFFGKSEDSLMHRLKAIKASTF
ncbi:MAG: ribulokinase [Arcanobacterium sp.]|nr:ribulokinase [Arcanobacterium sp.]